MYIDFMGTDAAIFRTLGKQTAMRTDQYNSRWLNGEGGPEAPAGRHVCHAARASRGTGGGGVWPCDWLGQGTCLGGGVFPSPAWGSVGEGGLAQLTPRPPADPSFIHAELIPDSAERNDDKLYFFFRERSAEAAQSPAVYARIGRICLVRARGPLAAALQTPRWLSQPCPAAALGVELIAPRPLSPE